MVTSTPEEGGSDPLSRNRIYNKAHGVGCPFVFYKKPERPPKSHCSQTKPGQLGRLPQEGPEKDPLNGSVQNTDKRRQLITEAAGFFTEAAGFITEAAGFITEVAGFFTEAAGFFTEVAGFFTEAAGFFTEAAGFFTEAAG
ncbi:hypothetical protein chiPu_0022375 [Chiloscyllium punctatum]|uniref:Uncharacterized protein n=1 Tax=Chiloscyllium punctatum TaxID=137246 RepID=A0A401RKA1_CHIPU|nr:hypothetical protein [Chiloscyllium punctatum]